MPSTRRIGRAESQQVCRLLSIWLIGVITSQWGLSFSRGMELRPTSLYSEYRGMFRTSLCCCFGAGGGLVWLLRPSFGVVATAQVDDKGQQAGALVLVVVLRFVASPLLPTDESLNVNWRAPIGGQSRDSSGAHCQQQRRFTLRQSSPEWGQVSAQRELLIH